MRKARLIRSKYNEAPNQRIVIELVNGLLPVAQADIKTFGKCINNWAISTHHEAVTTGKQFFL